MKVGSGALWGPMDALDSRGIIRVSTEEAMLFPSLENTCHASSNDSSLRRFHGLQARPAVDEG